MRIGELSRTTGASARSLRYYEQRGVLSAVRSTNGYRDYGQDAVGRVAMIRTMLAAGLPMEVVRDVLVCTADAPQGPEACGAVFDRMQAVRDGLDDQADRLRTQVVALDGYLALRAAPHEHPPGG